MQPQMSSSGTGPIIPNHTNRWNKKCILHFCFCHRNYKNVHCDDICLKYEIRFSISYEVCDTCWEIKWWKQCSKCCTYFFPKYDLESSYLCICLCLCTETVCIYLLETVIFVWMNSSNCISLLHLDYKGLQFPINCCPQQNSHPKITNKGLHIQVVFQI